MSDDSFASLFEAQGKAGSKMRSVRIGQTLQATVVQIGRDEVFLELDGKRQAYISSAELLDETGALTVKIGDALSATVISVDPGGGDVRLGRSFGKSGDMMQIEQARASGISLEGKVLSVNKGGIEVDLGKGTKAFCPMRQIASRFVQDANEFVGQTLRFHVTEIKEGGKSIVLSRRSVLEAEAREGRDRVLAGLSKGATVRGQITSVRDFGAFVDLGGIEGLIPASEMAHDRSIPIADRVKAGEMVEAQVIDIRDDEKVGKKITLSLKALIEAPAGTAPPVVAGRPQPLRPAISIGQVVAGKVVRIETYGVFIQLNETEGRFGRGLIPASELGVPRGVDLRKSFPEGTELSAVVLETGDNKLKLSVKGAKDAVERADFESHRVATIAASGFGTFGDLLSRATKKK
jgi:small subunit ribosomal protein S1